MTAQPPLFPAGFVDRLFRLDGRVAVITGGASGLGAAVAEGFLQAGASIVIADRNAEGAALLAEQLAETLAETPGSDRIMAMEADVTSRASMDAVAAAAIERFGKIDILFNSAGISKRHTAEDFPEDDWDRIMRVNHKGSFLACQAIGTHMLAQKRGSIINMASIGGFSGYPGSTAYTQSKGAIIQMTRGLAVEWIDRGVRVNALAPSVFGTPMILAANTAAASTTEWLMERTPIGRYGNLDEIIGPALFLASDASSMVTGHILSVDGGYMAV